MATLAGSQFNTINGITPIIVGTGTFQVSPGGAVSDPFQPPNQSVPVVLTGVSALPLQVPFQTAPAAQPIFVTGLPTPTNVQSDPASSTVMTAANPAPAGLLADFENIIFNPTQNIVAFIVILLAGWWLWKKF